MVAPALIAVKHKTTPTQLGFLSGGTTFTQIGTSIATGESFGTPYGGFPSNRGVWFKGCYFVVCLSGSWKVTVFDPIANTVVDYGLPGEPTVPVSSSACCTGLFVTKSSNPVMFFCVEGASQQYFLFTTTDGYTWSRTTVIVAGQPLAGVGRGVLYRNQLYIPTRNGTSTNTLFLVIDPVALTATTFDNNATGWGFSSCQGSVCVFRNRLYLLRATNTLGNLSLFEFTGGTFVNRSTLVPSLNGSNFYSNGDHFLFPVGNTKMVAIAFIDTGNTTATRGTKAWDLVPTSPTAFTATDKTTTLIPTSLRRSADGGAGIAAEGHRWTGFVDNDANSTPDAPKVYIWLLSDFVSGVYSYYEYIDSDTELGPGASAVSQDFALPYGTSGGGERTYVAGNLKALVTAVAPSVNAGRSSITATVYGDIDPSVVTASASFPPTKFNGRRVNCRAATTTALPSSVYNNGAGTLTGSVNGALAAQDGVTLIAADRLLVKNQAAPLQNGIYTLTTVGDGSNPFVLTRATDFDTVSATEIAGTAWTFVTEGTTQANTGWYLRLSDAQPTLGTTALTFQQITSVARFLRLWYSASETPNMTQSTLAGTPTQAPTIAPLATRNGSALENVVADGATTHTFEWNATADGLQNGQPVHVQARGGVV